MRPPILQMPVKAGKVLVVRDVPRNNFVLVVNNSPVAEFRTASEAWEFAEEQFGVVLDAQSSNRSWITQGGESK